MGYCRTRKKDGQELSETVVEPSSSTEFEGPAVVDHHLDLEDEGLAPSSSSLLLTFDELVEVVVAGDDGGLTGMETISSSEADCSAGGCVGTTNTNTTAQEEEEPLFPEPGGFEDDDESDPFELLQGSTSVVAGSVIETTTTDPWLPVSSGRGGVSAESHLPCADDEQVDSSRAVLEWLDEVDGGGSNSSPFNNDKEAVFSSSDAMPPTVTDDGAQPQPAVANTAKPPIMKNNPSQAHKGKNAPVCGHIVKGSSMPGLRKALKGDIKVECSQASKSPCGSNANLVSCLSYTIG
jgi:hypothetical protein